MVQADHFTSGSHVLESTVDVPGNGWTRYLQSAYKAPLGKRPPARSGGFAYPGLHASERALERAERVLIEENESDLVGMGARQKASRVPHCAHCNSGSAIERMAGNATVRAPSSVAMRNDSV